MHKQTLNTSSAEPDAAKKEKDEERSAAIGGNDDTISNSSGSSSSGKESGEASEFFGDNYIKKTDDSRINRTMGVGACALHPCLTRKARKPSGPNPVPNELSMEHKVDRIAREVARATSKGAAKAGDGQPVDVVTAEVLDRVGSADADDKRDDDEGKLAQLLKEHATLHSGRDNAAAALVAAQRASSISSDRIARRPLSGKSDDTKVQNAAGEQSTQTRVAAAPAAAAAAAVAATTTSKTIDRSVLPFAHSQSTGQLRQSDARITQEREQQQQQHYRTSNASSASSLSSVSKRGGTYGATQSDNGATAGAQLVQRRKELEMAGMRHSEAAAHAVRSMERGLVESMRSGADTPTVDLVQTAVSVREVSKLIGRTVVQVSNVRRIMVVTKPNDTSLVSLTRDLATWLIDGPKDEGSQPIVVYVEERIAKHRNFNLQRVYQRFPIAQSNLQYWTPELCAMSPEIFDFVVTLGGDGTVLYTSWLFQKTVPPIIPFHLGSLGFLTVFDHKHARRVLGSVINNGVRINLRMRFTCTVYRLADAVDPEHANVLVDAADCNKVINHAMATHGIEGADEHLCTGKEKSDDVPGSANLAALHSMSAAAGKRQARTFSSSMRRPPPMPRSMSSTAAKQQQATASAAPTRAHHHSGRQSSGRASGNSGGNGNGNDSDSCCGCSSSSSNESGSAAEDDGGTASVSRVSRLNSSNSGTPPHVLRRRHTHSGNHHHSHGHSHHHRGHGHSQNLGVIYSAQTSSTANTGGVKCRSRSISRQRRSSGESRKSSSKSSDVVDNGSGDGSGAADVDGGEPLTRHSTINESEWDDVPKPYQRRMRKVWKRDSSFQVMNEVVVDRGPSPYLSQLELYGDGNHLTTVEADGLCLATPTGSTAYSLAAGGSLVHPEIPAILVTPICAHTLSFRPMLLPDTMVLRVVLPPDSRNTAWASFDGRHRTELRRGDHIQITASKYPLPTVCASQSQTQDWMSSLSRCLHWNERKRQKKFVVAGASEVAGAAGALHRDGASSDGNYLYKRGSSTNDNESLSDDDDVHEASTGDDDDDDDGNYGGDGV
ncbi:hypothetical protein GGI11_000610 [Coemansia sp. RSA 2049]|nr:hypothetical protein GGI11_000610 [Coemansia sp. RSA 2049]